LKEQRGLSQILFGFLPDQTVDLSGRVWRVNRWVLPRHLDVDHATVRSELIRAIRPWTTTGKDGRLAEDLYKGLPVHVLEVNENRGAEVEQFPKVFRCTTCSRLVKDESRVCACSARRFVQWHFVSYHHCGYLGPPRFLRCPTHDQVRVILSGTAAARDLRFECPVCSKLLHKGFFMGARCDSCDDGTPLHHDVHRAAQVYSAKTLTVVNPPDATTAAALRDPTTAAQKLDWVLEGMPVDGGSQGPSIETVVAGLVAAGFSSGAARQQAEKIASEGALGKSRRGPKIVADEEHLAELQQSALRLWLATSGGRTTVSELCDQSAAHEKERFETVYPQAMQDTKLEAVELLEDFPVLTMRYGYTRGPSTPGEATLRRFRTRDREIAVHGQLARTEGLLIRLDPMAVADWLSRRGQIGTPPRDVAEARARILEVAQIPDPYDEPGDDAGSDLLTLVHSMSHRLIRVIASLAGIERDAIAEYLIPEHLSFVLYAAARGDFVLGGMQALFEHDLNLLLNSVSKGDPRCPLDPGCRKHGAACVACLHVGEPSCRHFNRFLNRDALFDSKLGFLSVAQLADLPAH
jgi:hypothetical protein